MSKNNVGKPFGKELSGIQKQIESEVFPLFSGSTGGPLNPLWYMAMFKGLSRLVTKRGRNYR